MWSIDKDNQLTQLQASKPSPRVWLASDEMVFYKTSLPLNRRYAWAQLVPFALEEQVIGDPERIHFAIGALQKDAQVPVLAVAKEKMDACLELLAENSVSPEKIWPDVLAVPYDAQSPVLWHEGGHCWLRLDEQTGLAGSLEWLLDLLSLRSEHLSKIKVYSDAVESLPESLRDRAEALPRPLHECMMEAPAMPAAAMNLLQGDYRLSSPLKIWFYPWLKAAAAGLVGLSFYLAHVFMQAQMIDDQNTRMRQSVTTFFQSNFPDGDVRTMRSSVAGLIERLQRGADTMSTSPWLALLRVDRIISQCKECRVEQINLNEESVAVEISSSATFDSLLASLSEIENLDTTSRRLDELSAAGQTRQRMSFEFKVKKA